MEFSQFKPQRKNGIQGKRKRLANIIESDDDEYENIVFNLAKNTIRDKLRGAAMEYDSLKINNSSVILWRSFDEDGNNSLLYSIPSIVEKNSDLFKSIYLSWLYILDVF